MQVTLGKGVTVTIKYKASSDLLPNGTKEVFFEINGVPRVIQVVDKKSRETPGSGGCLSSLCLQTAVWSAWDAVLASVAAVCQCAGSSHAAPDHPGKTSGTCELQD